VGGNARDGLAGGSAYDSATAPVECGSGGGRGDPSVGNYNILGRAGGGALRLDVAGTLNLLGALSASGINVSGDYAYGGGGAGGSIWVTAGKMTGTGYIYAFGGSPGGGFYNGGGGGAGGRVAVYAREYAFGGFIPTPEGSQSGSDSSCWGGDGTAVLPANHPIPFEVIAGEPLGLPTGPVNVILVTFNSLLNYDSISQQDFLIRTPSGTVPVNQTYLQLSTATAELHCPGLTEPGQYQVQVGPHIANIYGLEMTAPYTFNFTLRRPIISGAVVNNHGYPIPGIQVRTEDGSSSSVTDAQGVYGLNTPAGNFTFKPVIPGAAMVPPSVSISNLSQDITNVNFTVYAELPPRITVNPSTSPWRTQWWSTTGFTYQPQISSNLVDWADYGQPQPGTGGLLYINLPALADPSRRFTRIKVPLN
jgi:hypothetical protein